MRREGRDVSEVLEHVVPILRPAGEVGAPPSNRWWRRGRTPHRDTIADVIAVYYAPDLPGETRYVTQKELRRLSLSPAEFRGLAIGNLRRQLGSVARIGGPETYMISTGNENEASLLLVDRFWRPDDLPVDGDFVVSVPGCDVLMVTGSLCPPGVARLRQLGRESFEKSARSLTTELLVRREGTWAVLPGWKSAEHD